jgi:hypothetical protein
VIVNLTMMAIVWYAAGGMMHLALLDSIGAFDRWL